MYIVRNFLMSKLTVSVSPNFDPIQPVMLKVTTDLLLNMQQPELGHVTHYFTIHFCANFSFDSLLLVQKQFYVEPWNLVPGVAKVWNIPGWDKLG